MVPRISSDFNHLFARHFRGTYRNHCANNDYGGLGGRGSGRLHRVDRITFSTVVLLIAIRRRESTNIRDLVRHLSTVSV